MIHYSCDRCHKILNPAVDLRYVVRVEIMIATTESDEDPDVDHLEKIEELLNSLGPEESDQLSQDLYRQHRFDLCAECRRVFAKDPLGAGAISELHFSEN